MHAPCLRVSHQTRVRVFQPQKIVQQEEPFLASVESTTAMVAALLVVVSVLFDVSAGGAEATATGLDAAAEAFVGEADAAAAAVGGAEAGAADCLGAAAGAWATADAALAGAVWAGVGMFWPKDGLP